MQPEFASDINDVLQYLGLGDRGGLAFHHRAQDLQSWLMHREAAKLLRANPTLVARAQANLARWMAGGQTHSQLLWERWAEILAAQDWDAALANTGEAQQLRQASPLTGLLPEDVRLAVIRYVRELAHSRV